MDSVPIVDFYGEYFSSTILVHAPTGVGEAEFFHAGVHAVHADRVVAPTARESSLCGSGWDARPWRSGMMLITCFCNINPSSPKPIES